MKGNNAEKLYQEHKNLIPKLAKKYLRYQKYGIEYEDLYQEASIALYKAARDFNPKKWAGKSFENFAVTRMYQYMMNYYVRQNMFYTPVNVVQLASTIKRKGLNEKPISEIAKTLGVKENYVENALIHLKGVSMTSLNKPLEILEGNHTLIEMMMDKRGIGELEEYATLQMFRDELKDEREKLVFDWLLEEQTTDYMGKKLGVSRAWAGVIARNVRSKFIEFTKIEV